MTSMMRFLLPLRPLLLTILLSYGITHSSADDDADGGDQDWTYNPTKPSTRSNPELSIKREKKNPKADDRWKPSEDEVLVALRLEDRCEIPRINASSLSSNEFWSKYKHQAVILTNLQDGPDYWPIRGSGRSDFLRTHGSATTRVQVINYLIRVVPRRFVSL